MGRARLFFFSIFLCTLVTPSLHAEVLRGETACGGLSSAASGTDFGPFDYRSPPADKLKTVQRYHFTPNVESLRRGESGSILGTDIDFTLRYFPNHTRALTSMVNLAQREKTNQPNGSRYSVDCWFDRAVRFVPDDAQVSILYGFWLLKKGERALAIEQFEKVSAAETRTGNIAYNLGLGYFEAKEYDKSLIAAHEAYAAGFNFPGLKNKLEKAGKWRNPVMEPSSKTDISAPPTAATPVEERP